jgi:UDP-glucose 4-epimerase
MGLAAVIWHCSGQRLITVNHGAGHGNSVPNVISAFQEASGRNMAIRTTT